MSCNRLVCSCNGTMPVDGKRLAAALGENAALPVHRELCRGEAAQFVKAASDQTPLVVACTQEAPVFNQLANERSAPLRFVNIRENAGWSAQAKDATPKMAALLAAASLPEADPVPSVTYRSEGKLLITGHNDQAIAWAVELSHDREVSVLLSAAGANVELPDERSFPVYSGRVTSVKGYLGNFEVQWEQVNPIDLEACVRCGACVRACPESAIAYDYQIDLDKCRSHRQCVAACGEIRAIDFSRSDRARSGRFDLILDLGETPLFAIPQPPQGYFAAGADARKQAHAIREVMSAIGDFEKPRYFQYDPAICAHSRSKLPGCNRCIEVCSTQAISSAGDKVSVEPHLCMGCGGCATVCPSGAMTYAYPKVSYQGRLLQAMLGAYRAAGGKDACLLVHDEPGAKLIAQLARHGRGLPARVIPLSVHHTASFGLDLALGALALGANQVYVLGAGVQLDGYREATAQQLAVGQMLLESLGYGNGHLGLIDARERQDLESKLWDLAPARQPGPPAQFELFDRKRTTLRFAVEHFSAHAPAAKDIVALVAGAPFGTIEVNRDTCTLCMACVGACPENAIHDGRDRPQLRFIESNCVQCGLCEAACPEDAISLVPRLLLTSEAKTERVLNEDQPFNCVRCGKPFGTRRMIDNMVDRLVGHSMFTSAEALQRVRMCADCRVIDMMQSKNDLTIFDIKP
ncbi:MAG: 4Fe-4S binding protein [Burkholderiales bacterium]